MATIRLILDGWLTDASGQQKTEKKGGRPYWRPPCHSRELAAHRALSPSGRGIGLDEVIFRLLYEHDILREYFVSTCIKIVAWAGFSQGGLRSGA
ncbi:hypothetical protein OZN62_09430 [Aurantiacibacter sp. MUD11]|uniref:hypothetical protein n=1 Tax=Aurantiacibacter sp. MUD11 TaxID=3003265 RepID=UPI0022AABCA0|nr:hypothetical protein [Aurantiacibacter sp. MUD11]WAT17155.1 hypothetical protein OZN62_09430 [Aurantiacibacter sp. MUD11]